MRVVFISRTQINLLGTVNLGNVAHKTARTRSWNVTFVINNKAYTVSSRIPSLGQLNQCAVHTNSFNFWTCSPDISNAETAYYSGTNGTIHYTTTGNAYGTVPFATITGDFSFS